MQQGELFETPSCTHEEIKQGDYVRFRKISSKVIPFDFLRFEGVVGYVVEIIMIDSTPIYRVFFGTEIIDCRICELTKK